MSKKVNWLEKFAEAQATKIEKTASLNKKAAQVIIDQDDCQDAQVGKVITYKNEQYKVVQTDFHDELGNGIVLEKMAEGEEGGEGEGTDGGEVDIPTEGKTAALEDIKDEETADEELEDEELPVEDEELKEEELPVEEAPVEEVPIEEAPAEETPAGTPMGDAAIPVDPKAQPVTMAPVGGPKAPVSAPIVGPGQKKVTDPAEHPVTDPGDVYHIEVRDTTEVQDFQAAAAETEQAIAQEDSVDRTTVDGHYTWNQNRILDRMVTDLTGVEPAVEEPVAEEPVAEEPVVEEPVVEEPVAEKKEDKFASNKILKKIINGK